MIVIFISVCNIIITAAAAIGSVIGCLHLCLCICIMVYVSWWCTLNCKGRARVSVCVCVFFHSLVCLFLRFSLYCIFIIRNGMANTKTAPYGLVRHSYDRFLLTTIQFDLFAVLFFYLFLFFFSCCSVPFLGILLKVIICVLSMNSYKRWKFATTTKKHSISFQFQKEKS